MSTPQRLHAWFVDQTELADPAPQPGVMRQWLVGAATALATIAIWALMVWLGVLAVQASGLLPPSIQP